MRWCVCIIILRKDAKLGLDEQNIYCCDREVMDSNGVDTNWKKEYSREKGRDQCWFLERERQNGKVTMEVVTKNIGLSYSCSF